MRAKTIFIIIMTVLVTVILMNNTDSVTFWIFGDVQIPKLAILGVLFALGFLLGFLARGQRKRVEQEFTIQKPTTTDPAIGYGDTSPADDDFSDENYIR